MASLWQVSAPVPAVGPNANRTAAQPMTVRRLVMTCHPAAPWTDPKAALSG
ncbi:MAG: hypothetical protein ACFB03_22975 [Paracoccaceae bacterium]